MAVHVVDGTSAALISAVRYGQQRSNQRFGVWRLEFDFVKNVSMSRRTALASATQTPFETVAPVNREKGEYETSTRAYD